MPGRLCIQRILSTGHRRKHARCFNGEHNENMSPTIVRPARAVDKDAVLAFTQNTWEWGDYISYVWEQWLADSLLDRLGHVGAGD